MAVAQKAGMAAGSMRGLRWIDECVERSRMVDHAKSGAIWLAAAAGHPSLLLYLTCVVMRSNSLNGT